MRPIRLGAGAGYAGDRIEPAADLAREGALDALIFECLAERTVAKAQVARARDPRAGCDPLLERRMRAVLPACAAQGTRVISNMGAANPRRAGEEIARIAAELGLGGLRVAVVEGDDVLDALDPAAEVVETGAPVSALGDALVSANAYLGAAPILEALEAGAEVVVTGRVADPSLFVAPILHHFGWAADDWTRLGQATLAGHMLECAGQVTGGYFAGPGRKATPGLVDLGFPIGELHADGALEIGKLPGAGGMVTTATCKEQMLYEVFDPAAYRTPDVTADFSAVRAVQAGPDRVRMSGADGRAAPARLKVSLGCAEGWMGEGMIFYAGAEAEGRARLAREVLETRLGRLPELAELRVDLLGVSDGALALGAGAGDGAPPGAAPAAPPREVGVRAAALCRSEAAARRVGEEVEALYVNGPAGGGGARVSAEPLIAIRSAFMPRAAARPRVSLLTA